MTDERARENWGEDKNGGTRRSLVNHHKRRRPFAKGCLRSTATVCDDFSIYYTFFSTSHPRQSELTWRKDKIGIFFLHDLFAMLLKQMVEC